MLLRGENFGYINFDDDRLAGIKIEDLHKLEKAIYELFGEVEYFLLNEIQNVEGWKLFLTPSRQRGFPPHRSHHRFGSRGSQTAPT
jgi:predicted AAA+ superfamily ATPase